MADYWGEDEPWLVDIRKRAQDAASGEDWDTVVAMESELRQDTVFWPAVWGPMLAIAKRFNGVADARRLLDELVTEGFSQPELFSPTLAQAFGAEPDWPRLLQRMRANVPPTPVELLQWPQQTFGPPLTLDRLKPELETRLATLIPEPKATAWDTAVRLLGWVSGRWQHANDHVAEQDAVEILRRVDAGGRFACVEYSTVLSQSLCASGIPARSVDLWQRDYHTGFGKGHMVSEAWIDELGSWVVLDGQNGMYWVDRHDHPQGIAELESAYRSRATPLGYRVVADKPMTAEDAAKWWRHFAYASTAALAWGASFVPIRQTDYVQSASLLLHDGGSAHHDLSELSIGVVDVDGGPALKFHSDHPF
ncbi:MAG: transglutaminase domain-containing protein, partial [Stackebrandtia sp.]